MKPVKVMPRFKCDFCKRRSTKSVMEKHEKRCFRNPNRFCDYCENKGYVMVAVDYFKDIKEPCPYCSRRDLKMEEEINKYKESIAPKIEEVIEVPF